MFMFLGKKTKMQAGDLVTFKRESQTIQFGRGELGMSLVEHPKTDTKSTSYTWPFTGLDDCLAYMAVLVMMFDLHYRLHRNDDKFIIFELIELGASEAEDPPHPSPAPAT